MDHDNQVTALRARIASAETERDAWRSAGMQDSATGNRGRGS